jgi:GT2 family glycosyltransferase
VSVPRVSVAMATYNGLRHLDAQLESLLGALAPDDELVVVDDASTDGTWERLQALGDARVRLFRNASNLGVRASFGRALSLVRGEVVLLADQDDVWEPRRRDALLAAFDADPRTMVAVSDASLIDGEGRRIADSFMATRGGFDGSLVGTLVRSRFLGCAMAVRRDVLALALPIPARAPMHDMWLGVVGGALGRVAYVDEPLLRYRRHGGNVSPSRSPSRLQALRWRLDLLAALAARRVSRAIAPGAPRAASRAAPVPDEREAPPLRPGALCVGIVVYRSELELLRTCLHKLARAVCELAPTEAHVYIVDNGPDDYSASLAACIAELADEALPFRLEVVSGHGNVGYGHGNNLAIERGDAEWHLILNPDAELEPDALRNGIARLAADASVGMIAAWTAGADGQAQHLCKTYPSVAVLGLRALGLPFGRRLAAGYDVVPDAGPTTDVTGRLVSGSFMLCRASVLKSIGGFDPAYFLYFEDFDLSLRLGRVARVLWARDVRIVHHGGSASRKGWLHRRLFVRSAATFFSRHGWRLW